MPLARLVDRLGQGRVLGAGGHACPRSGCALLVLAVERDVADALAAPLRRAGRGDDAQRRAPPSGPAGRTSSQDRSLLDTAFAVEAVNDEVVFIVGPTVTTLLASAVHPLAGLVAAGVASLAGTVVARRPARHRAAAARGRADAEHAAPDAVGAAWRRWSAARVMLGVLFGGTEVATVAFADEAGSTASAGAAARGLGARQPDLRG